jgi:pseudouridine-5'-phosphate glycosidase
MPTSSHLDITDEVTGALDSEQAVVALESTIISHGMPYPQNVETALEVEQIVRENGAIPATIAVQGGRLKVGLSEDEITHLGKLGQQAIKTSRRDLPFVVARKEDGATTVAATMIIAAMAGIRIFATGGIGGVHRGAEESFDISADLEELARSNVAVVCAGIKSVLDIGRTLEYLETKGVPVVGYQTDTLPAFYTLSSGYPVDYRVDETAEIAHALRTKWSMGFEGGMVIANPIPKDYALDEVEVEAAIADALADMKNEEITGKDATPFLLQRIVERTGGRSLEANIQLVINNARLAAKIAAQLAKT